MTVSNTTLTEKNASVYISFQPGTKPSFLGNCIDLDSLSDPKFGGINLTQCHNRMRDGYETMAVTRTPPGPMTFSLAELLAEAKSDLEDTDCPWWLLVLYNCGQAGLIQEWKRGYIVGGDQGITILNDTITNVANHVNDDQVMHTLDVASPPGMITVREIIGSIKTNALTYALNAVSVLDQPFCGNCGEQQVGRCDYALAVGDAAVAAAADAVYTVDGGTTWTAFAADPFAVNLALVSCVFFTHSNGQRRMLVARATAAGVAMQVAYSDDLSTTWTVVTVGATVAEAATGPRSLIALDWEHIWLCTDQGEVYFSNDGGETWTAKGATAASGANPLNAISFIDENYGIAVGDADTVIYTNDGGTNWVALAATALGVNLTSCQMFSPARWIIGSAVVAAGALVMTFDGGTTYEHKAFVGHGTEAVADIYFINQWVGVLVSNTAAPVGSIHFSKDGGHTWEERPAVTNDGLNSAAMCRPTYAYLVGEVEAVSAIPVTAVYSG